MNSENIGSDRRARRVFPDSLLARTFLLIAALIVVSVLGAFQILRVHEREPRARELAQQTVSLINLTRAALVNADPQRRIALLRELNDREGIRVYPALAEERLEPLPADPLLAQVTERVRYAIGELTRFAYSRDGVDGFWVSFFIDIDEFWLMLPRERIEYRFGIAWLAWGAALILLALGGAWWIASRVSTPLTRLTAAAQRIGRGESPEPLAETGARELRSVSAAFNRMTRDLAALEDERATVLAGISHDLRTPLARLKLALEMSGADAAAADGMRADIDDINQIIGQFLDFARRTPEPAAAVDLRTLIEDVLAGYRQRGQNVAFATIHEPAVLRAAMPLALRRAVINLIDNALRHAGEPVEVALHRAERSFRIEVADRGTGIPPEAIEELKRPFTRRETARSGTPGAGLGLAIVERIARQHGGTLTLANRPDGGLVVALSLPAG